MKKYEIEISRHNVTPAQFLAYVRAQLKKKGLRDITDGPDLDYFRRGNDLNFYYHDDPEKPCKAEKSVSHPYETQTYVLNWDGTCYNEICEFEFDDEKTGHGYFYLLNTVEEETAEETTDTEEATEKKEDTTMKKITERRFITPDDLRRLCIKENWYTKGDNDEYDRLLSMCRKGSEYAELTIGRIAMIADDIQQHSDVDQSTEYLTNIMYLVAKASTTCFEIEE